MLTEGFGKGDGGCGGIVWETLTCESGTVDGTTACSIASMSNVAALDHELEKGYVAWKVRWNGRGKVRMGDTDVLDDTVYCGIAVAKAVLTGG